jgi:hypothetical protein
MCDLYLNMYMLLYVYVAYPSNGIVKSGLPPGCSRQLGYSWGRGASNRTCASNKVCLLLMPQWPQTAIKLTTL